MNDLELKDLIGQVVAIGNRQNIPGEMSLKLAMVIFIYLYEAELNGKQILIQDLEDEVTELLLFKELDE